MQQRHHIEEKDYNFVYENFKIIKIVYVTF